MKRLHQWLLIIGIIAGGCHKDPVGAQGCDPCRTTAIAYGSVLDSAGGPVAHVPVNVVASETVCDQGWRQGYELFYTDSTGDYRGVLSSIFSPFTARCITVTVNPAADPKWPTDTVHFQDSVEFRAEANGVARDSIRLDVHLGGGSP